MKQPLETFRTILNLVWSDTTRFVRIIVIAVLSLIVLASVLTALAPVALKLVVDALAGPTGGTSLSATILIALYVLSQYLARAIGEIRGLLYARVERGMFRAISERFFAHLMRLPLRFHVDRQTGAVCQTLESGLQGYQMIVHHLVFTFLPVTMEIGTIAIVIAKLAPPAFLGLLLGALVCYALAFGHAMVSVSEAAETASSAHIAANATMTDCILNYETVKYFSAESIVQERVSSALSRTESEWVSFYRRYALNGLTVASIFAGFLAANVLFAVHEVVRHRLTVGDFVLINSYMLQIVRPVEMLGYAMQGLSQGVAMLERMMALFRETPESPSADDCAPLNVGGKLEFEDVSMSYGTHCQVLRGLRFAVPAGRTVAVVGASGSGKSTLVRLLMRLAEPDAGRILLDDVPISELPLSRLRQAIAVVPQDTVLFNDTIAYNIGFGRAGSMYEEIIEAAKIAHLHDFIVGLPERYDTKVGERGVKLSGGERQRVSIARATLKRPRIYVFDEATSSLDTKTEMEILRHLREVARDCTTLVIAHRLSTVIYADEIVVLDRGTIVERGTHTVLMQQDGHYANLWASQQAGLVAA